MINIHIRLFNLLLNGYIHVLYFLIEELLFRINDLFVQRHILEYVNKFRQVVNRILLRQGYLVGEMEVGFHEWVNAVLGFQYFEVFDCFFYLILKLICWISEIMDDHV